ncbi:MAG: hypothetical protein RLZZ488_728 [Pseudomonadota bacterium]|jgi:hypothetical protein
MKSYFKSIPFAAIGLFVSQYAHAAGVNFHFLVNSSGTQIYPCDAGLYDPNADLGESWLSANYAEYDGNKVTSTTAWSSLYLEANLTANTTDEFKTVALNLPGITAADTSVGTTKFATVLRDATSPLSSGGLNPDELTFNLGSQKYGAKYFVDFCFRDSRIAWIPTVDDNDTHTYEVRDSITTKNIAAEGEFYWNNSSLSVIGKIVCDNDLDNIKETVVTNLDGISGDYVSTTDAFDLSSKANGATQKVFDTSDPFDLYTVDADSKNCIIRYIFSENATTFRRNDLKTAEFAIELNVKRKY